MTIQTQPQVKTLCIPRILTNVTKEYIHNTLNNLKTLCAICHTRKGKESGDFNAFKSSSRIHKV